MGFIGQEIINKIVAAENNYKNGGSWQEVESALMEAWDKLQVSDIATQAMINNDQEFLPTSQRW